MRLALFFKLFKQDRAAAVALPPEPEAAETPAAGTDGGTGAIQASDVLASDAGVRPALQAANSNVEAPNGADRGAAAVGGPEIPRVSADESANERDRSSEIAPVPDAIPASNGQLVLVRQHDIVPTSDAGDTVAATSFDGTAELIPHDEPLGQERALADLSRAAAVTGRGLHIAVVASADLLADAAIHRTLVRSTVPREADIADWVYVHNFEDASAPRALRLPAGTAPAFASAVHEAVGEALARLEAAVCSEDRADLCRSIDAATRDALDDRLLAIKSRAEAQNLAVLRTPGGYAVAPVHDGKVVKPEVFARLPEAMRVDVEQRVRAMQDELAATLAERPLVERERRQKLAAADAEFARDAVDAAFHELCAAYAADAAIREHLDAVRADLMAMGRQLAEAPGNATRTDRAVAPALPRRMQVNVFLTQHAETEAGRTARVVTVQSQASAAALVGHARRTDRRDGRSPDHLDLAAGAAHYAAGGVLYVDAGCLAHFADGATALGHMLASSEVVIEGAAPELRPQPIPLAARVVVVGDGDDLKQLSRLAPGLLGRLRSIAHCDEVTVRGPECEAALAGRLAHAVAEHDLHHMQGGAVAALIDIAARLAGDVGLLSCRLSPLIDIAREADVLARLDGRDLISSADIEAAASARERSLAAFGASLARPHGVLRGGCTENGGVLT